MSEESVRDFKARVRAAVSRERRESAHLIGRWTRSVAAGNGHAGSPRTQTEPRMTKAERDELRRDLEEAGVEISPFLRLLLEDGS